MDWKKLLPFDIESVYGHDDNGSWTPYLTRLVWGQVRVHVFHRGDKDPDLHDHPWGFWTFPLVSYVEEALLPVPHGSLKRDGQQAPRQGREHYVQRRVVERFRWHYREATFAHRVLGRYGGRGVGPDGSLGYPTVVSGPVYTIIRTDGGLARKWGFWSARGKSWCYTPWRSYIALGGKSAPCYAMPFDATPDEVEGHARDYLEADVGLGTDDPAIVRAFRSSRLNRLRGLLAAFGAEKVADLQERDRKPFLQGLALLRDTSPSADPVPPSQD